MVGGVPQMNVWWFEPKSQLSPFVLIFSLRTAAGQFSHWLSNVGYLSSSPFKSLLRGKVLGVAVVVILRILITTHIKEIKVLALTSRPFTVKAWSLEKPSLPHYSVCPQM